MDIETKAQLIAHMTATGRYWIFHCFVLGTGASEAAKRKHERKHGDENIRGVIMPSDRA